MKKSVDSTKRLYGLDFIKVFAIAWIALYHFLDFRNHWALGLNFDQGALFDYFSSYHSGIESFFRTLLSLGILGVNMFILVSGLGLCLSINRKGLDLSSFFKRRFFRIIPPYWIVLLIVLLFYIFTGQLIEGQGFLSHFFAIHTFSPEFLYSLSTPLWFIGIIVQLYLLFPLLFKFSKAVHPLIFFAIVIVLNLFLDPILVELFNGGRFFSEFILDFSLGIYLGNLIYGKKLNLHSKTYSLLLIPAFLGLLLLSNLISLPFIPHSSNLIFAITSFLLFLGLFPLGDYFGRLKWVVYLSSLSYCFYLVHYFVLTDVFPRFKRLPMGLELILFMLIALIMAYLLNFMVKKVLLKKRF